MKRFVCLGMLLIAGEARPAVLCNLPEHLELRHPDAPALVVLSDPKCLPADGIGWRRIDLVGPESGETVSIVAEDLGDEVSRYVPEEDGALAFSPDGRFLTLFRVTDDGGGPWSREFLDLAHARWTAFVSVGRGKYASNDTFLEWAREEAHTAVLIDGAKAHPLDE
jgi:hypothetical protein